MRQVLTDQTTSNGASLERKRLRHAWSLRLLSILAGLACCMSILSLPASTQAQSDTGGEIPAAEGRDPASFEIGAGIEGRFKTDIEDGGKVERLRVPAEMGYTFKPSNTWRIGLRLGYVFDKYDFSQNTGFGALDPWDDIHLFNVSVPVTYKLSDRWKLLVVPHVQIHAESGADAGDGLMGGGMGGFIYSPSSKFSIGLALGAQTQIEDEAEFIILPIIFWQVTPKIILRTEIDVSRGYGGTSTLILSSMWQLKGGLSFEKNRFRLDEGDNIGETSDFSMWGSVIFGPSKTFDFELYTGMALVGTIRLEDDDGNRIRDRDLDDPQPFLGLRVNAQF